MIEALKTAISVFREHLRIQKEMKNKHFYISFISFSFGSDSKERVIAAKNFFHQRIGELHDEAKEKYL
jgi:hypothetical protein